MLQHCPPSTVAQALRDLWRERRSLVTGVVLLGSVLGTFLPAVEGEFVNYDDPVYVTANGQVQHGLHWETIKWAFSSSEAANWHPLTWLSHMLDCQLFGLEPWGHHLTSIMLHALNTLLVFAVLRRITGATGRSFIVALFFGLHPLRVESVAWVAERKDVLSTALGLLTLWAYAKYVEAAAVQGSSPRSLGSSALNSSHTVPVLRVPSLYYGLALACFGLGLMAKPMLVTVPWVLLLLDYWPLRRWPQKSLRALVAEKIPFFLAALVVSAVTLAVQKRGGAMVAAWPFMARAENAVVAYCRYLGKLFWPADLAVFYPPVDHWPAAGVFLAGFLLLALTGLAFALRRRAPFGLVGWLWFIGTLVPVIGLVQVGEQSMADRYSYIPSIGILLVVVWGVHDLTHGCHYQTAGASAAVAVGAFLCLTLSRTQISFWQNSESLFRHALLVTKHNYVAHNNLGAALDRQGRQEEAINHFRQSLQDNPNYPEAHNNLGVALNHQGRLDEAGGEFLEALRLRPGYAEAHFNLGGLRQGQGRLDEAIREYQQALRLNPRYLAAHYNLGRALERTGRPAEAAAEFQATLKLEPNLPEVYNNLGVTLERNGKLEDAISQYQAALKLKPDYARAHFNLGVALGRKGQLNEAIAEFQQTLRLDPDYAAAQTNLALALDLKRNLDKK